MTQEIGTGFGISLGLGFRAFRFIGFGLFKGFGKRLSVFGFHWITGSTIQRLPFVFLLHNLFDFRP